MAKRKTRAAREEEQISALEQRIADMMRGACGGESLDEPGCLFDDIDSLSRLLGAFCGAWRTAPGTYATAPWNLAMWQGTAREVAERLHGEGYRADGTVPTHVDRQEGE